MKAGKLKSKAHPRFSVDALREIASAKVFQRGERYFGVRLV